MYSRRRFLATSAIFGTTTAGGCLEEENRVPASSVGGETTDPSDDQDRQQFSAPSATAEWGESIVGTGSLTETQTYRVTITPAFSGVEEIKVRNTDGEIVRTVSASQSGSEVTVAGRNTSYGPAESGEMFTAYYLSDSGVRSSFSLHMVGSIEQPDPIPIHLNGIRGGTGENLKTGGSVTREFTYDVFGGRYRYTSHVPQNLIDHYERRTRIDEYGAYVSDPYHSEYLQSMADAFIEGADSERRAIEHARAFVQQLEYTRDRVSQGTDQYSQFPVETMYAQRGDCEDSAILLAAIYREMGYGTILIGLWDAEHMALGIKGSDSIPGTYYEYEGSRYYYVEPTASGWEIGDMPDSIQQTEAELIPVNAYPTLVFAWGTSATRGGVDVEIAVTNPGQIAATNVSARAEFETRFGQTVARDSGRVGVVSTDSIERTTLSLEPPPDETVRGRFSIGMDGTIYDEATTDWREPIEV